MVALGPGHAQRGGGQVGEVVRASWGELDLVEGEEVEVLPRDVPGHVGLVEAHREEEGPVVRAREGGDRVVGDAPVGQLVIAAVERGKLDPTDAVAAARGHGRVGAFLLEVVLPLGGAAVGLVVDLAGAVDEVAGLAEEVWQRELRLDQGAEVDPVVVDP